MRNEIFTIQKEEDYIGYPDNLKKIDQALREGKPILITGSPGIGKTSVAEFVAKKYNLQVVEINASDERRKQELESIKKRVTMQSFGRPLFLFDEIDYMESFKTLEQIISISIYPIILTANEHWKIPRTIVARCLDLQLRKPQIQTISNRMKKIGEKGGFAPNYSNMTNDVRHSIITSFFGGEGYSEEDTFTNVVKILKGEYSSDMHLDSSVLVWLLDNASDFFYGNGLYEFIQLLCDVEETGDFDLLRFVPKCINSRVNYPYFFKRLSVLRGNRNEEK